MEYTCIVCPNGCTLTVEPSPDGIIVTGHKCQRGEQYGRDEFTDPRRVVTAVVRTTDIHYPVIPVKTDRPVAKKHIAAVLKYMYGLQVNLPVHRGDVCADDCCGTGAAILFTKTSPPVSFMSGML